MKIAAVAKKYGLQGLVLFGSRAAGEPLNPESDYDVAYFAPRDLDFMTEARLITDLMPYFKSQRVDLCNFRRADPLLKHNIMRHYQPLYQRPGFSFTALEVYAEKLYQENRPIFDARHEYLTKVLDQRS